MIIAIEFDGGLVENRYPDIGELQPFAHYITEQLKMRGHQMVLVTQRTGEELKRAIDLCNKNGFQFDKILDGYADRSQLIRENNTELFLVTEKVLEDYKTWINLYWKFYPEEYDYARLRNTGIMKSRRKWRNLFKKRVRGEI